jgi:hypothetical protein
MFVETGKFMRTGTGLKCPMRHSCLHGEQKAEWLAGKDSCKHEMARESRVYMKRSGTKGDGKMFM